MATGIIHSITSIQVISHPRSQWVIKITVEVIKIIAVEVFLQFLGMQLFSNIYRTYPYLYKATAFDPLREEILCRGILQEVIHILQKGWNDTQGAELSEREKKIQQRFRIHLCALIFAALHLRNSHKNVQDLLKRLASTYLGGVIYGHLKERYGTLSLGILAHGLNNIFSNAAVILSPLFWIAVAVNKLGFLYLGTHLPHRT